MKKNHSKQILTKLDYEKFNPTDTRYYGLFYRKNGDEFKVKIDPKRFCRALGIEFEDSVIHVINSRKTHYFYPRKNNYNDYNCNVFEKKIQDIKEYWEQHYKDIISFANRRIKKPKPVSIGDNMHFMMGAIDYNEAEMMNRYKNSVNEARYQQECYKLVSSLYASFVHQFASQIESVTVYVLNRENAIKDRFDRNMLYSTAVGKNTKVENLPSFKYYDKLYCLWNFIKHNSLSTFEKLKTHYPELIYEDIQYEQGIPAFSAILFSEDLIIELLDGCSQFFKEYCKLVFDEDYEEAQWNYGDYFYDTVWERIELINNPLGLPF